MRATSVRGHRGERGARARAVAVRMALGAAAVDHLDLWATAGGSGYGLSFPRRARARTSSGEGRRGPGRVPDVAPGDAVSVAPEALLRPLQPASRARKARADWHPGGGAYRLAGAKRGRAENVLFTPPAGVGEETWRRSGSTMGALRELAWSVRFVEEGKLQPAMERVLPLPRFGPPIGSLPIVSSWRRLSSRPDRRR